MGTPCTSFASWSHLNKVINHQTLTFTGSVGVKLVKVSAQVAMYQLKHGRHFLIENAARSEIFQTLDFKKLWDTGQVVSVNFPQCAFCLRVHNTQRAYSEQHYVAGELAHLAGAIS